MAFRIRHFRRKLLIVLIFLSIILYIIFNFQNGFIPKSTTQKMFILLKNEADDIQNLVFEDNLKSDLNKLDKNKNNISQLLETSKIVEYKSYYNDTRSLKNSSEKYVILEYTKVFFKTKFCGRTTHKIFDSKIENCEYTNCLYTCDQKAYLAKADALIFHERDLEVEFKEKFVNFDQWIANTTQLPFKTVREKIENNPNQVWIMWNDEARKIDRKINWISELFNWTMSYKTDSEIFEGTYGYFLPNSKLLESDLIETKKEIYGNFSQRKNAILWFVSNCNSKHRLSVALEIGKYYPLHIYGRCKLSENLTQNEIKDKYPLLEIYDYTQFGPYCGRNTQCEKEKFSSYKYYLAFENRNCTDYLTEKIWKSFKTNMIPLILQPSRESYQRYSIPPQAFIHLEDFYFDVKKFTNYLKEIDNEFERYYNHLKWTYIYLNTYIDPQELEPHRMCQLCKKLNTYKPKINYKKIADFFNDKCGN